MSELSVIAKSIRNQILADAEGPDAVAVANIIIEGNLDAFNLAGHNIATSILCRAIVARAMINVAALWLNDVSKNAPTPECFAAVRSLIDDPPPEISSECWKDPSITD